MADFPKKQQQCLIPKYLLDYTTELNKNHPDPTDPWGGSGGDVNIEAGTGITITTESDDTKVISLDTTPSTFEVTATTGTTLEVTNQNPLWKDSKLQMTSAGSTRLEGTSVSLEANNIYLNSDSAPYYVNNTTHEYKKLATTDQIPDAVSGTNDGTNWTSLTIGNNTYGLAGGGATYTAGTGIDITNDTISVDNTVAMKSDLPDAVIGQHDTYNWTSLQIGTDTYGIPQIPDGNVVLVNQLDMDYIQKVNDNWPNVLFRCTSYPDPEYTFIPTYEQNNTYYFKSIKSETSGSEVTHKVLTLEFDKTNGVSGITEESISNDYNDLINTPTIPDTSNMVTTDTVQTITANKTFGNYSNNITLDTTNTEIRIDSSNSYTTLEAGNLELYYVDVSPGGQLRKIKVDPDGIWYTNDINYDTYTRIGFETPTGWNSLTAPDKSGTLAVTSDIITSYNDLTDKPALAPVATTGDYTDLTNKPTIPTVNNSTITIQKNGTTVDTFTLNQSTGKTINISVPTVTSDLTNDSGFITGINSSDVTTALGYTPYSSSNPDGYITGINSSDVTTALGFTPYSSANPDGYITGINSSDVITALGYTPGTSNFSGSYTDLTDKPTIPTDTSDLTNGAGFITSTALTPYVLSSSLATVATSGDYDDLLNKPTIPTVDYPVTDVQVNGTSVVNNKVAELTAGTQYIHHLTLFNNSTISSATLRVTATIINNSSTQFTVNTLKQWLYDNGYQTVAGGIYEASGTYYESSTSFAVLGIRCFTLNDGAVAVVPKGANVYSIPQITYVVDNVEEVPNLIQIPNALYYINGDKLQYSYYGSANGFLTTGGKAIQFSITTPKLLTNITSITVDNLYAIFRGVGGYVNGSSYIDYANTTGYTVTADKANDNTITIVISATTAFSSGTNNTPISIAFNPLSNDAIKLTFNAS